jgi:PPOX class probable F420-dependent enzyme
MQFSPGKAFFPGLLRPAFRDRKPKRASPRRLARLKNIQETPQVALLVDQYDEDRTRLWYVLVRGEADLVSAAAEHKGAIQRLRAKYPQS